MQNSGPRLPAELADRLTGPFARFLRIESASGGVLLLATLAALTLSNSPWSTSFLALWETEVGLHIGAWTFARSLRHWINDGLVTIFFFVVALELKREFVLGELRSLRMAALSLGGALGGMIVPAALYLALMAGEPGMHGWGVVMATDTAFVIGCLALLGRRIPASLRLFLLSLAIFDDIGAILVVAVGYGASLSWPALALAGVFLAAVALFARIGIRSIPFYFVLGGLIWLCFDSSGIHPTVAGVILGLMTPTGGWVKDARLRAILGKVLSHPHGEHWSGDTTGRSDIRQAGAAVKEVLSPVERLELMLHPWASFVIVPLFALANAGVAVSRVDIQPLTLATFVGLAVGKPVGVVAVTWLFVRLGFARQAPELSWRLIAGGALLTGVGFTMSLFIAGLAHPPAALDAAKLGILTASAASAALGILSLAWLTARPRTG